MTALPLSLRMNWYSIGETPPVTLTVQLIEVPAFTRPRLVGLKLVIWGRVTNSAVTDWTASWVARVMLQAPVALQAPVHPLNRAAAPGVARLG